VQGTDACAGFERGRTDFSHTRIFCTRTNALRARGAENPARAAALPCARAWHASCDRPGA